jgi:hypothetical protein
MVMSARATSILDRTARKLVGSFPQVWKIPAEGGASQEVLPQAVIAFESEDKRFLYYCKSSGSSLSGAIWRAPIDGSGEEELVLDEQIFFGDFRIWRGNVVFLVAHPEEGPSIRMIDLSTREVTRLADLGRDVRPFFGLTVSPDGLSILYGVDENEGGDIMLVENPRIEAPRENRWSPRSFARDRGVTLSK